MANFLENGLDTQNFNYQKQIALGEEAIARAKRAIHGSSQQSRYRDVLVDLIQCAGLRLGCSDPVEGSRTPTKLLKTGAPGGARAYGAGEDLGEEIGKVTSDSAQSERTGGTLSKADAADPAQELTVATVGRGAEVTDFLLRCNRESGVGFKVIRKHIWLGVGHTRTAVSVLAAEK